MVYSFVVIEEILFGSVILCVVGDILSMDVIFDRFFCYMCELGGWGIGDVFVFVFVFFWGGILFYWWLNGGIFLWCCDDVSGCGCDFVCDSFVIWGGCCIWSGEFLFFGF